MIPGGTLESLYAYFHQFPKTALSTVKIVAVDMSDICLNVARTFFRRAVIVIDKFHVVQHLMEAIGDYRKRKQRELKQHKDLVYQLRHAFCARSDKLAGGTQTRLAEISTLDAEFRTVHECKEEFLAVYRDGQLDRAAAETAVDAWIGKVRAAGIPEFLAFVATYENWKEYILNYFDCRCTNGLMEGCNNRDKVIRRMSYGFRRFATLRGKLLFELSGCG